MYDIRPFKQEHTGDKVMHGSDDGNVMTRGSQKLNPVFSLELMVHYLLI